MSKANFTKDVYTVQEVASLLSVHEETVRRWLKGGKLEYIDLGYNHYRIPVDSYKAFLAERTKVGAA
jgi:excisionase family DNA binding protein